MKIKLIALLLAGASVSSLRADFNPVTLTANSYTFDIVVESNTVQALPYCINVTAGSGTGLGDNTYFEQGLVSRAGQVGGNAGIPIHNTVFTNINNANMTFIMPPTYATNNELMIDSTFTSGTLHFNTPVTATNLAVLGAGGGGSTTIAWTATHTDSSVDTGSLTFPDWFTGGSTVAWGANGRITVNGGYNNYNNSAVNNNAPYLYANKITVTNTTPITSISFAYSSGQHGNIYAVSGNASAGIWTPIPLSGGFNVIGTVPAAFPLTATMDQGTNTVNNGNLATWFEQGFVSNTPTAGLPPSGTLLNSQIQPTHHYQLGNYKANNAILIDTNHLVSTIVPASPSNYTAFAFLTAGGNVGGTPMQDICILQHADGVNETNLFFGYDWFNQTTPGSLAYKANGRVNMYSRTVNNVNNGFPYLFETYFTLTDITSPVTNIIVKYKSASGSSATTYIMAISASTDPIPPVITLGPIPATQSWFQGQTATFSVQVAGTVPITNAWQVIQGGTTNLLTDGVDANGSTISGSTTTTLTISNLKLADLGKYQFVASNAVGSATSGLANLDIKGTAGVVLNSAWNNIDNVNYSLGSPTTVYSSNGVTAATLTLSDAGANNGWNSGITGDMADFSLMHGYIDAGANNGLDAVATISGLTDPTYDVYLYCFPDQTRPAVSTNGLPNYTVNGTTYYAPLLGGNGASSYNLTSTSIGGAGFPGYIQATTRSTNDFLKDLPVSNFGDYIKISGVSAIGGQITVQAGGDTTSIRSPLNGIQIVSTSTPQNFGIHFLGTGDYVAGPPVAPVIDAQTPITDFSVLTNHFDTTTFSVTVDGSNAPPFSYQWYNGASPIAGATNASFVNSDSNNASIYCIVTNFVGSITSTPIAITIFSRPALSSYQAGIINTYHPAAYWPLTETAGSIAFDYAGTNDGIYTGTNTLGQPGLPATVGIGANTSVGFDGVSAYVNIPVGNLNITNAITLIQWVQPPNGGDTGFGTSLGHGDSSYRLSVVGGVGHFADAGPDIVSPTAINDGNWHLLVGVYDGTNQYLYVDGQLSGTPHTGAPAGNTGNLRIGGAPDYNNRFFAGNIAQVAILTNALTASQVMAVYDSLDTPPSVSITPVNPSIFAGSSVTFTAHLSGTTATSLRWYSISPSSVSNNIAGATNATYTIPGAQVTTALDGYTYGIVAANAFGSADASTTISVQNGPANIGTDISPLTGEAYVGAPVTYSVGTLGSLPIYYQWTLDGLPVAGATNATFTLAAPCGTHSIQVTFTNSQNAGSPAVSSTASLQGDANPTNITFFTNGLGWTLSPVTFPNITGNVLTLTDGNGNEAATAFYNVPQYVGSFHASFVYVGDGAADGAAFIIQNSSSGVYALGGAGGGLGYSDISNSVALKINLYTTPGIAPGTNGVTFAGAYGGTGPINVASADPIQFTVNWANGVMSVAMLDLSTLATYATNYAFGPITDFLSGANLGYIGFSGGTGGSVSTQTITDFEFNSTIPPVGLTVSPVTGNSFQIKWSNADPNYVLQKTASLTSPSWTTGPVPTLVNGVNQVSVDVTASTQQYYRLVRVVCQ